MAFQLDSVSYFIFFLFLVSFPFTTCEGLSCTDFRSPPSSTLFIFSLGTAVSSNYTLPLCTLLASFLHVKLHESVARYTSIFVDTFHPWPPSDSTTHYRVIVKTPTLHIVDTLSEAHKP
ncbi:hypothetical protein F5141DRAFT_766753 [Pisolithus sp. B1]|nr:hypothetical protein F5141DRAFT_766753 [Pisolithus sp. B1]